MTDTELEQFGARLGRIKEERLREIERFTGPGDKGRDV